MFTWAIMPVVQQKPKKLNNISVEVNLTIGGNISETDIVLPFVFYSINIVAAKN